MSHLVSRRHFLTSAGALGLASLLPANRVLGQNESADAAPAVQKIPRRPFGKTGVNVSILGMGGMFDITTNQLLMRQALRLGANYWDTADCYSGGKSEEGIGAFFEKFPESRKEVFLVTKSDKRDPAGMSELLERSLGRLKTDHIDLYFIHGLKSIGELNDETKQWAEKMKSAGKIKFFGFSTHANMEQCMTEAAKLGWIDGIMTKVNYRLLKSDAMKAAIEACTKAGIGLTAMKVIGKGAKPAGNTADETLLDHFTGKGFSPEQAMLKAVWENENFASACVQMPNMTLLTTNVAAALDKTKLASADYRALEIHAAETACNYCAGCTHLCESALAEHAPVGDVLRALSYHHGYGEHETARATFLDLPERFRAKLTELDYKAAEARCPHGVRIAQMMREANALWG